jgi:hypothetical protein
VKFCDEFIPIGHDFWASTYCKLPADHAGDHSPLYADELGIEADPACVAGPNGCDPSGDRLLYCRVCSEPVCDFHGEYADDAAYAEGDWRCPAHTVAKGYPPGEEPVS